MLSPTKSTIQPECEVFELTSSARLHYDVRLSVSIKKEILFTFDSTVSQLFNMFKSTIFLIVLLLMSKAIILDTIKKPTHAITLQDGSHMPSMQVEAAWDRGYTGTGVKVAIVDDGIETTHDDLETNFVR